MITSSKKTNLFLFWPFGNLDICISASALALILASVSNVENIKNHKKKNKTQNWLLKIFPGDFFEVITQNNVKKSKLFSK